MKNKILIITSVFTLITTSLVMSCSNKEPVNEKIEVVFNNETYGYYMLSTYFYLVFSFISQLNDQSVSTELINSTSIISSIYQINDMIHNNQLSEEYNRQTIENQFSNDYTTLENLVKKFNA